MTKCNGKYNYHQFTSTMQRTMTEIPVVRKFSSKKVFNISKQPCKQRAESWDELQPALKCNNKTSVCPLQYIKTSLKPRVHSVYLFVVLGHFATGARAAGWRHVLSPVCEILHPTALKLKKNIMKGEGFIPWDWDHYALLSLCRCITWAVSMSLSWKAYIVLKQVPVTDHSRWILCFCLFQTVVEIFCHQFTNLNIEVTLADNV